MTQLEAIKKEIERLKDRAEKHELLEKFGYKYGDSRTYETGLADAFDWILSFIESLEQKSQCDGCVNDKGCVTCVDGNMKETQPKGLDEAAEEYARQYTKNDNGNGGDDWEDEKIKNVSIAFLEEFKEKGYENAMMCIDWLKSLRPQPHWKPSDEQRYWLALVIDLMGNKGRACLKSLYNDLKKL